MNEPIPPNSPFDAPAAPAAPPKPPNGAGVRRTRSRATLPLQSSRTATAQPALDGNIGVTPVSQRRPGPDVVRALAILGVIVMNYHGYLIIEGGQREGGALYQFFDPWLGPLSTRFAATFVLTAGIGISLLTRRAVNDPSERTAMQWRLVRRGLLLYGFGLVFDFVWYGTILPYYGAMFVLAAVLFVLPSAAVLAVGATAAVVGWLTHWWATDPITGANEVSWLEPGPRSPLGMLINVFFNGTHPLFPWLAFFCTGIVVGRQIVAGKNWRPVALIAGATMFITATIVAGATASSSSARMWSDDPFDRSIVYTASALGTALLAFGVISFLADRFATTAPVDLLRRAGQLSLTIYLAHALLFNLLVNWLGLITPGGLGTALGFALTVWVISLAGAAAYQRRFGRGPAETVYRRLTM